MKRLAEILRSMSRRQRSAFGLLLALIVVSAFLETAVYLLLAPLAQTVSAGESTINQSVGPVDLEISAARAAALLGGFIVLLTVGRLASLVVQSRLSTSLERIDRRRVRNSFLDASWEAQATEPPGRIQAIVGMAGTRANIVSVAADLYRSGINLVVMLTASFVVAPLGALAILVLGAVLLAGFRPLVAASKRLAVVRVAKQTDHNEELGEMVAVAAESRVFGAEDGVRRRLTSSDEAFLNVKRRSMVLGGSITPVYQAIGLTIAVAILGFAINRNVDVTVLVAVALLMVRSVSYGQALQSASQKLADIAPSIDKVEDWLRRYSEASVSYGSLPLGSIDSVELRGVSYSYGDVAPALDQVSVSFDKGEQIGLVGPSGSGKSTMAQLLLRLRSPSSGDVLFNGVDIAEHAEQDVRRQISLVPQSASLIRGTIEENIRFFRSDIAHPDVVEAARMAGLLGTIEAMPDGFQTMIGPGERDLSGGQKQRLGIARSLAGRPSLIIFDEPTSALDTDSEELIIQTLEALRSQITAVVVAHRMSTLRHCDRVIVLDNGEVEAVGTPDLLLNDSQYYRRAVVGSQASGRVIDPLDTGDAQSRSE